MDYLADTVAIVRHLRRHPALGRQAARILDETDAGRHRVFLSPISLMEVLYLAEARKIDVGLAELVAHIRASSNYVIVPLDDEIVLTAVEIDDVRELHDRILVATAKFLAVPLLTGDKALSASRHVTTIW